MPHQLTTNEDALRLFFTDDLYVVAEDSNVEENTKAIEVQEQPDIIIPPVRQAIEFKFLGGNGRNILILVNDADNEVSDDKGKELLRKIVKSIGLTAADFALLNYAKHSDASFDDLIAYFSSKLIFSFGVTPAHLGLSDRQPNILDKEGDVNVIFSNELRLLDQDLVNKKALWAILQTLNL
ncbi:MAG: hypothetical protein V4687_15365 [Bacteroidota bacterium]